MDEERGPDEAQMVALFVMAITLLAEADAMVRWLRRGVWIIRCIALLNVTCGAWNASRLHIEPWWLPALGLIGNSWAVWRCLQTEIEFQGDIKEARARLRAIEQKIERVRNENRA